MHPRLLEAQRAFAFFLFFFFLKLFCREAAAPPTPGEPGGRSHLVQLIVQLGQAGPEQLLAQVSGRVPVVVDAGHGVHGVVAEGAQVVGVGMGVIVVVVVAARVQAALAHHRVAAVLHAAHSAALRAASPGLAGALAAGRRVHEVHPKPALGFLASLTRLADVPARLARPLGHQVHLEAALARRGTQRLAQRILGALIPRGPRRQLLALHAFPSLRGRHCSERPSRPAAPLL